MSLGTPSPSAAATSPENPLPEKKWKALTSFQRRVVGVLMEKAKTTPEQYPLTLNALVTGCNQKTNRDPQLNLSEDQVEQAIDELREMGAAVEVQGSGRVPRYRHLMYEWLDVDKAEAAIMTELLLRGAQTVGELRGHAARMEPIPDLAALKPLLQSLVRKGLVLELTSEGRGQVVCHALYREREFAELRARYAGSGGPESGPGATGEPSHERHVSPSPRATVTLDMHSELRLEVAELRAEVARLRTLVQELAAAQGVGLPASGPAE